jgi:hypothetical protein
MCIVNTFWIRYMAIQIIRETFIATKFRGKRHVTTWKTPPAIW